MDYTQFEPVALMRLACSGLTLAQAQIMPDNELLWFQLVGRKTIRYVRWTVARESTRESEELYGE